MPSARQHWSLYAVPEQIEDQTDENDEVLWELEKFLRLALKANPNILEVLWTPIVLETTPLGNRLRGLARSISFQASLQNLFGLRVVTVSPHEKPI